MEYTIIQGTRANALEVYFNEKPARDIIDGLKGLKMRWNGAKKCWYGFTDENLIKSLLDQSHTVEYSEGYLGAVRTDGNKSHLYLYGADLLKAIRQDLKIARLPYKTSTKSSTYSGGQFISVTIYVNDPVQYEDITDDQKRELTVYGNWIATENGEKCIDYYWDLTQDEREKANDYNARTLYGYFIDSLNSYSIDEHNIHSAFMNEKQTQTIKKVRAILDSFRYDDSNCMVDYFNTNFYYDIRLKYREA